jgi:hypothetical protein
VLLIINQDSSSLLIVSLISAQGYKIFFLRLFSVYPQAAMSIPPPVDTKKKKVKEKIFVSPGGKWLCIPRR